MRIENFGSGQVKLILKDGHEELAMLDAGQIKDLFKSSGALIFRGYDFSPQKQHEFAMKFSTRFNRDRKRPVLTDTNGDIQLVTEGMGYVEPHCEQANSPFRPDAIWFCCVRPAEKDGETLFWDGVRILDEMNNEQRQFFQGKKIRFFQKYPKPNWQLFLGGEDARLEDAKQKLDAAEGVSYYVGPNEEVYIEYVNPAIVKTKYTGHEAFANSLLTERANTLGELMSFTDGTLITDEVINELIQTMDKVEEVLAWQAGDMVFLDNSRYMHGRNAYTDRNRELYACMSFLNF